jgi:hypothetical protein
MYSEWLLSSSSRRFETKEDTQTISREALTGMRCYTVTRAMDEERSLQL